MSGTMEIPKWLERQLMAAFRNSTIDNNGWYPIHDGRTNERLCKMFGLATDHNEHKIGNAFRVRFDWTIQRWRVSA